MKRGLLASLVLGVITAIALSLLVAPAPKRVEAAADPAVPGQMLVIGSSLGLPVLRHNAALDIYTVSVPNTSTAVAACRPRQCFPNYVHQIQMIPNDPLYAQQWAMPMISAPQAWDVMAGITATSKLAVLDTGCSAHEDVAPLVTYCEQDIPYYADLPDDYNGHSTHVSCDASCVTNNATGVAGTNIAPIAIEQFKVCDNTGSCPDDGIIAGLTSAADRGANVANMSFSCTCILTEPVHAAFDYAMSKGVVLIAAAGNNGCNYIEGNCGPDVSVPEPASYCGPHGCVIAVGATDGADSYAAFTTQGTFVALGAPGVAVLAACPAGAAICAPDTNYKALSGTSMASPIVAGVAAALHGSGYTTEAQIRDCLTKSADPIPYPGLNNRRLNAYYAMLCQANPGSGGTPTPTPTATPTASPTASPTPTVTVTPKPTKTPRPCNPGWFKQGRC